MCASIMIPAYRHSVSSVMPLDLNEDQNHELFTPNHHSSSSFSSLSSYPILFNPSDQDQETGSYYRKPAKHLPSDEEAEKIIPTSGSWDHSVAESEHKVTVWKKEERNENHEAAAEDGSVKWMPSKMRMMRKMMVSDQADAYATDNTRHKFEDQKQPLSLLGTDHNSSNNYSNHSNNTVRVCTDCHTTKTPLWRSGPRGPKSLCNACGIRQRKARRAMAAAAVASGNGTVIGEAETSVKGKKLQKKEKKSRIEGAVQMKKKRKLGAKPSQSRNKFGFEDLTLRLRKNLAMHQVFPQDEKEAAILLMALSYGLVHG
ncbi:putative GATA transcription factor 22 [Spatholobus suberectus]|nr:putative GATA transcription factor 22 [Spatholobus suberectus]